MEKITQPEVFISYAHADNPPRYESRDWERRRGWVDCFATTLSERLRQVRGRQTEVWRDDDAGRLGGASLLNDTIRDALHGCAVLISIASPSYCASQWCETELRFFQEGRAERGGLRVGNRLRVFKVNKLPFPATSFLGADPAIADSVGYPFHRMVDGLPLELDPPHGGAPGEEFCRRVNALAYDIVAVLDARETIAASGTTIFLGSCSTDVVAKQDRLRSELRQFGHEVLPLESGEVPNESAVRSALQRSRASIHVIGEDYRDETVRDYDLAGEVAESGPLVRLSWLPPGAAPADPRQLAFVERLKLDPQFAALTVTLEDFKTIVKDRLRRERVEAPVPAPKAGGADDFKRVYLIFDPPDRDGIKPVDDWLYRQGFEVVKSAPGADAAAFRKLHNGRLRSSDGVLIYHGNADEQWLEAKLDELWKTFSATRQRHPKARGVVLADPSTPYKREFRARIARVIPGFGDFDPATLADFAEDVRRDSNAG